MSDASLAEDLYEYPGRNFVEFRTTDLWKIGSRFRAECRCSAFALRLFRHGRRGSQRASDDLCRLSPSLPRIPVTVTLSVSRRPYRCENRDPANVSANTDSGDGMYAEVAFHIEKMIGQAMYHERSVK